MGAIVDYPQYSATLVEGCDTSVLEFGMLGKFKIGTDDKRDVGQLARLIAFLKLRVVDRRSAFKITWAGALAQWLGAGAALVHDTVNSETRASGSSAGKTPEILEQALWDYAALRAYAGQATRVRLTKVGVSGIFQRDDADTTSGEDNGGTLIADALGRRWVRRHDNIIEFSWFVRGDGSDESAGVTAALATGAAVIRARKMTVRFENVLLTRGVIFDCEDVTFKKLTSTKSLWKILGGDYAIRHKGVRIDGGYTSSTLTYSADIVVSGIKAPGLKLYFEDCDFDNIGNWAVSTGYHTQDSIYLISVSRCRSNGRHKPRLNGSISGVFSVANTRNFRVNGWRSSGDGVFIKAVSLASFDRMPACSLSADNTICTFQNVNIENECGVILYSGCHDSSIVDFNASGCAFGIRILNARNCSLRQAVVRGCVLTSVYAVEWSPYLRLGSGIGSVVEEDVMGFTAENLRIEGGGLGFGSIGAQVNGSGAHGVQNARSRRVSLMNVHILSGGTCLTLQDADEFEMLGGEMSCSMGAAAIINVVQSVPNGAQRHIFSGVEIDRKGGTGRVLSGGLGAGQSQLGTEFQFLNCKYKGIENISSVAIYWRGAGVMRIEGGVVDADPKGKFVQVSDTGRFVFRNVAGLTNSSAKVAIDRGSVRKVEAETTKD